MSLVVVNWGGRIMASKTNNATPVEIWSCSMSLLAGVDPDPSAIMSVVGPALDAYHNRGLTHIDGSVVLDYVKVNEFDPATGHQITDPTEESIRTTPVRGTQATGDFPVLTTAYRVTLDNNTRSRTTRGGWFIPRPFLALTGGGRIDPGQVADCLDSAHTLIDTINAISGVDVGIWSRKNNSVTKSTRIRVGDVPDNISTRKNALDEAYLAVAISS